jgi:hypothetical protein
MAVMESMRSNIRASLLVLRGHEQAQPFPQRPRGFGQSFALAREGLQESKREPVLRIAPGALREVRSELVHPLWRELRVQVVPQLFDELTA